MRVASITPSHQHLLDLTLGPLLDFMQDRTKTHSVQYISLVITLVITVAFLRVRIRERSRVCLQDHIQAFIKILTTL